MHSKILLLILSAFLGQRPLDGPGREAEPVVPLPTYDARPRYQPPHALRVAKLVGGWVLAKAINWGMPRWLWQPILNRIWCFPPVNRLWVFHTYYPNCGL